MNLKDFIAAVRRYWLTFVLVTGAALAVGLAWIFLTAAKFVSTAQLMVSIEGSTTATAYQNDDVVAARINTYIPLLTSGVVTQRVIDELGLPLTTAELGAKINATRVPPRTAIIDVTVTDNSPQQAQRIADALASEFVEYTDAIETPTGEDAQKVHTTVISSAGPARGNYAERILLGLLVALAAPLLGAVSVWARARSGLAARKAEPMLTEAPEEIRAAEPVVVPEETAATQQVAAPEETPAAQQDVTPEETAPEEPATPEKTHAPGKSVRTYASEAAAKLPDWRTSDRRVRERFRSMSALVGSAMARLGRFIPSSPVRGKTVPVRDRETVPVAPVTEVPHDKAEPHGRHHTMPATPVTTGLRERTPWLLGFICFLIPALPTFVVPPGPLKSNGSPAKIIAIMFFGLVILGFLVIRRTRATRAIQPGVILILLYFVIQLAVYGIGVRQITTEFVQAGSTRTIIMLFAQTGLVLFIITRLRTTRQRTFTLGCLAVGLTYACVVGLLQSAGIDLRYLLQPPGFVYNLDVEEITGVRLGVERVNGTSQHSIEFSVLAAITVPLTIHFARFATKRPVRWLAALGCVTALLALPAAVSRTGLIALTAALLVYLWNFKVRHIAVATVGALIAAFAYSALVPGTAQALWKTIVQSETDTSVQERLVDYAQVSETFRSSPLFGMGFGTSDPTLYGFLDNEWLQVLVQGGLLGIAGMFILVIGGLFGISAALRAASTPRERDQAYAVGAVFVAVLSSTFTFDLSAFQQASLMFFVAFGMLWSTFSVSIPGPAEGPPLEPVVGPGRAANQTGSLVGVR